ncbi:hypothetical protein SMD44_08474 [Streptomyces alboflavus]|uniref:Uncharacterized protein n=1 Tax=Streptomyces alboflavus TaxID=67267 RepID=A0A1Z1WRF0_9ACTN|nr:hypothetical protein SMD44_08474 [Streptomyces alboflavus]
MAGVETGDGGHTVGVGRGGAQREEGADAVAGHGDWSGADLGLCGEEGEPGVGVALGPLGGVGFQQGHEPGDDRGPGLFVDVVGEFDDRGRAVAVVEVRDEHVVAVARQLAGHLLQDGPQPEGIRVHQHPRVPLAVVGERGERVGRAARGGYLERLGGMADLPSLDAPTGVSRTNDVGASERISLVGLTQ